MKQTKQSSWILLAILFGSVLISGSVLYTKYFSNLAAMTSASGSPELNSTPEDSSVVTKDGEKFVIEPEEPVTLTVVSDQNCENCNSDDILTWLRGQLGSPVAVRRLEYASTEGANILEQYDGEYLPFLLLGNEIEAKPNFAHLMHHVITQRNDHYLVDLEKTGVQIGRYLDVANYGKDDPNAPKITLVETERNLGEVKLSSGVQETEFVIRNEGRNPLVFLGLNTSCGCTSARVVTPQEESPTYLMAGHAESVKWRGELVAGEEGKIIVLYDPSVHPDLNGDVMREVYITTNDPNTPQATLRIFVNQIPE